MNILLITLILLLAVVVFDLAAVEWGGDSRPDFDESRAPLLGAR